jgi:hypothetical protein
MGAPAAPSIPNSLAARYLGCLRSNLFNVSRCLTLFGFRLSLLPRLPRSVFLLVLSRRDRAVPRALRALRRYMREARVSAKLVRFYAAPERWPSGLRRTLGKRV